MWRPSEPTGSEKIPFVIYGRNNELKITVKVEYMQLKTVPVLTIQSFWTRSTGNTTRIQKQ